MDCPENSGQKLDAMVSMLMPDASTTDADSRLSAVLSLTTAGMQPGKPSLEPAVALPFGNLPGTADKAEPRLTWKEKKRTAAAARDAAAAV